MALMSQVSTGFPRVPRDCFCPVTGIFITLSDYGRIFFWLPVMQSEFAALLHGYWLLHFYPCPWRFHSHSDKSVRKVAALFSRFRTCSIFCWMERIGQSLPVSFPAPPAYMSEYRETSRNCYPWRSFQNSDTGSWLSCQDLPLLPHRRYLQSFWSAYGYSLSSDSSLSRGTVLLFASVLTFIILQISVFP